MKSCDGIIESEPLAKSESYYVSKIRLTNFRNYVSQTLELDPKPIVFTGFNGSGKTNMLEAVSFLAPGRGLRSSKLEDLDRISSQDNQDDNNISNKSPWGVAAEIRCGYEEFSVGTGRNLKNLTSSKRIVKIDENVAASQAELARIFSVMWLTPQMDGLFIGSTSDRRKFLDRLVYNFDPEHASRVYSYEYSMRERMKLLQNQGDKSWISVLENKLAEKSIAIALARIDAIEIIQKAIYLSNTAFPKAKIAIEGDIENLVIGRSALQAEEDLRKKFFESREKDFINRSN